MDDYLDIPQFLRQGGQIDINFNRKKMDNLMVVIETNERLVTAEINGEKIPVCHWRKGINRKENTPSASIDIQYEFLEKRDTEELSKDDAIILVECLNMAINDASEHGF